jgi:MFS family permease
VTATQRRGASPAAARPARARAGMLAWAAWALAVGGLATIPWFDQLARQARRPELTQLGASTIPYVAAVVIAATVGAVLASRRPSHPVGWLLLALALSVSSSGVADGYARHGLVARPGALPGAHWVAVFSPATLYLALGCVGFILLLTPTGSLPSPSPGWRWWARVAAAAPVGFLVALTLGPGLVIPPYEPVVQPVTIPALAVAVRVVIVAAFSITVGGLAVGAGSLVVRFRHADPRGVERQQLRWLALAAAITGVGAAVFGAGMALGATAVPLFAAGVCLALLPLATGAAILRYRLYDLDRIISRTLAYGLLTVILGLGYTAVVLGIGQLLRQHSSLAVAGATLAVAAAFQPARRRIQRLVDRRFDRRRYDAAQTIAVFSARLRQQLDLDTLTAELLAAVDQTMQPTQASLWLRPRSPPPAAGTSSDTAAGSGHRPRPSGSTSLPQHQAAREGGTAR